MQPLLVLFDIDGTLVDTAGAGRRSIERAFVELWRVDPTTAAGRRVPYAGRTDPQIFRALARAFAVDPDRYRAGEAALVELYLAALVEEMARPDPRRRVLPGVAALLEGLCGTPGVHLGLVTGNLERGARAKLAPFGLSDYFPAGGFGSDHVERASIARVAHHRLSRHAGIDFPPSRVVVVGDTEHDVACARANGFRALAVATGTIPSETLRRAGPDALFSTFDERPDAVRAALGLPS
ncbi:MAG TPA: HAD family hydrolase [Candidatus Polarisedimenticolaceae bacterium]|nr:HAD family hydrolase [Candidatus Polarisedimenticolaceae bacterium]